MNTNHKYRILVLSIFSIAMGLLEAAVVIYLRKLLYPGGFDFPLEPVNDYIITLTEILREAATIIMLVGVGYLYGHNFITRFAAFLYSFAMWDIFYYAFLKLILGWPESLFTWDVLFLIPVTWVGPVLAPILVSITMIYYAFIFTKADHLFPNPKISKSEWLIIISSSFVILISFIWDSSSYLIENNSFNEVFNFNSEKLLMLMHSYQPQYFNWWIFGLGELGLLMGIIRFWRRVV